MVLVGFNLCNVSFFDITACISILFFMFPFVQIDVMADLQAVDFHLADILPSGQAWSDPHQLARRPKAGHRMRDCILQGR